MKKTESKYHPKLYQLVYNLVHFLPILLVPQIYFLIKIDFIMVYYMPYYTLIVVTVKGNLAFGTQVLN